jgi:hypothetical protein
MSRRLKLAAAASVLAVAALVAVVILSGGAGARGSTVSRGAGGWLAARRYLEARGARVTLITEPLGTYVAKIGEAGEAGATGATAAAGAADTVSAPRGGRGATAPPDGTAAPGVLALVFPWQTPPGDDLHDSLDTHLSRGGDLLIAYSGEPGGDEQALDFWRADEPVEAPLVPWRWYQFVHREWDLRPARAAGALPRQKRPAGRAAWAPVRVWAPQTLPDLWAGAEILYTGPGGRPVAWMLRRHGGRVVVIPADALTNGRLTRRGNADLLETLFQSLGRRWAFDEYHHGLATVATAAPGLGRAADLLSAHLVLLYLLAIAALARRQGPSWAAEVPLAGSAPGFLLGIGALHHRLGHHREAARLLLRRVRELDRGVQLPEELDRQAENAGPDELVALARQVARLRGGGGRRASAGEPQ